MKFISSKRHEKLKLLEEVLKYEFTDINLLNLALTHSSYANENKKKDIEYNERIEFLGDSVLSIIISEYLYKKYPDYPEGELTKVRAIIVCEPSLARIAKKLGIGNYMMLGKGEEATGGRERVSILADAFEALLGAMYLDSGLERVKPFIISNLNEVIEEAVNGKLFIDYKTHLQEVLQKRKNTKIEYSVIKEEGPDHNKTFYVTVKNEDVLLGKGKGKSKKEAEQNAARAALEKGEENL